MTERPPRSVRPPKIRSGHTVVEVAFPAPTPAPLEIPNPAAEARRVAKRLRSLLVTHLESARRMHVAFGPDDIRSVIDALLAEAERMDPAPILECPEELRHYLRRTMFDELAGEPSNILYTTRVREDVVRYEAMPAEFWKTCLKTLRDQLDRGMENLS